jgi:hypothetical protein
MNLSPLPIQKFFDNAGNPLNGGLLFTYVATTTTKLATYQDQAGALNANPVKLDFRGEANVWLDPTLTYKFVLAPEGDTDPPTRPIWSVDNIRAGISLADLTQQIIGGILYPRTANEAARSVTPINYWYPVGYVPRYMTASQLADFLAGTASINQTTAIQSAINSVSSDPIVIGTTTYTGGDVYFPRGKYLTTKSALDIHVIGLTFQGDGSRNWQDYKLPPTSIIFDGTGSTSADFGINFPSDNSCRDFCARDISFEYNNSFAGDLVYGGAPGMCFERCSFGSTSISGGVGVRPVTANSLVRFFNGHHYRFIDCSFTDAQWGIIIDNALAPNCNGWMIHGCSFYDFAAGFINTTDGGASGVSIIACDFDPINLPNPTNGVVLVGVGFVVEGCNFAGSNTTNCPTASYLSVNGDGAVIGNNFNFQPTPGAGVAAVLAIGGNIQVSNNRFNCTQGLIASGACNITGNGNNYQHLGAGATDVAVLLNQNSASYSDIGPDTVGAGFLNSYSLTGSSTIGGFINYSPDVDASTGGPIFQNVLADGIRIRPINPKYDTTTTGTLTVKQTGQTFSASGATYTLPASTLVARGIYYRIIKFTAGTVVINAGAGTNLYDGAAKASLTNSTAGEIGVSITIEFVDSTHAVVIAKTGTWA